MIHWKFIFIVSKRAYYVNTWWRNFLLHLNDIKRLTTFCLIYENLFRRSKRLFLTRFATRRKLLSSTLRTVSSISYYLAKICAPLSKMKWLLFYHFDVWLQAGKRDNYKWLLSHWEGKKTYGCKSTFDLPNNCYAAGILTCVLPIKIWWLNAKKFMSCIFL